MLRSAVLMFSLLLPALALASPAKIVLDRDNEVFFTGTAFSKNGYYCYHLDPSFLVQFKKRAVKYGLPTGSRAQLVKKRSLKMRLRKLKAAGMLSKKKKNKRIKRTKRLLRINRRCRAGKLKPDYNVFYVDPINGSAEGNGSASHPWRTIEEVISSNLIETYTFASLPYHEGGELKILNPGAPIKGGDTILLRSGYHGEIYIDARTGGQNQIPITIAAEPGNTPQLKKIFFRAASNWIARGLSISPSYASTFEQSTIVDIDNHGWQGPCSNIKIDNCEIFSKSDSGGWTLSDWQNSVANAIRVDGDRSEIVNNKIRNINFGISVTGEYVTVSRNYIKNFGGDAIRGLGDYGVYEYNTVENAIDLQNGNHDDGFQSWSVGEDNSVGTGVVKGITLRGNKFFISMEQDNPLRSSYQGIGCFDGYFEDWVVENNVVMVDHWHGITLMGARNSRVVNNTVIDLYSGRPGPSWISVANHKNGTAGTGNIVRNNLANSFNNTTKGVISDHNLEVSNPDDFFEDPAAFDLSLKKASPAIDAGTGEHAPSTDIIGTKRPSGAAVDIGAYEWFVSEASF